MTDPTQKLIQFPKRPQAGSPAFWEQLRKDAEMFWGSRGVHIFEHGSPSMPNLAQKLIQNSREHAQKILESMRRLERKGDEAGYAKAAEAYKMYKGFDRRGRK